MKKVCASLFFIYEEKENFPEQNACFEFQVKNLEASLKFYQSSHSAIKKLVCIESCFSITSLT